MTLQTVFFEFVRSGSPAKELNQTLSLVRERFNDTGHRIINVETVEPQTFMGFQLKAGGLRIWYEAQPSPTPMELVQPLWDQVSSEENAVDRQPAKSRASAVQGRGFRARDNDHEKRTGGLRRCTKTSAGTLSKRPKSRI